MLTNIDANLSNFMRRFDEHVKEDKEKFDKLDGDVYDVRRYIWMVIGILGFVSFVIGAMK